MLFELQVLSDVSLKSPDCGVDEVHLVQLFQAMDDLECNHDLNPALLPRLIL